MLPIEDNPRIYQEVFRALAGLGVTLVAREGDARVFAQPRARVGFDLSGRIFI